MSTTLPPEFAARCGWYDSPGGLVLISQIPEPYFGEPMILVSSQDQVGRLSLIDDTHVRREDGTILDLDDLSRSSRYHEEEVTFVARGVPLAGTLITPTTPGPHPAAVLVHGAAGGQRDFNRLFVQPFLDAGVGVLIYDKAGHGLSGGGEPTIFDQADAASAALDVLRMHLDVDAERTGLAGISNGMWAVPMVASRRSDVAFVVGIGSPGVSMAQSEVHRRTKILRDSGVGERTVAAVARAWRAAFAVAAAGTGSTDEAMVAELEHALAEVVGSPDLDRYIPPGYVQENPMLSPIPPLLPARELVDMLAGEPDPELMHDPFEDYRKVRCRVLLQYGAEDTSVPVLRSVERITEALGGIGAAPTIRVYPGLEHLLNVVSDHVPDRDREAAMYTFRDFTFGPGVRAELTNWLATM
jgi:pimeloyl-ACP methyl ester carboxylesterase